MTTEQIDQLNARHAVPGGLRFEAGPGGLVTARIANEHAEATVSLQGAQVTAFQPRGAQPVLFLSRAARFAPGRAIRGGIPICWPWFGPHSTDPSRPDHGFVRTLPWSVLSTEQTATGTTALRLGIGATEATLALWPHQFSLELLIEVGPTLRLSLRSHNPGPTPFTYTGALHSYLSIGDIATVSVDGLDGDRYLDKVDAMRERRQSGAVTIAGETDRVYQSTTATCALFDPTLSRRLQIAKTGSQSTVIWNPWQAKAATISDLDPGEYRDFICVETANALRHAITIEPGASHAMATTISVEPGAG